MLSRLKSFTGNNLVNKTYLKSVLDIDVNKATYVNRLQNETSGEIA